MYQDYAGNYDTSSRGSSTSPAQPESFASGSSTIGSPISTSTYQVTLDKLNLSMLLRCVLMQFKRVSPSTICAQFKRIPLPVFIFVCAQGCEF